MAGPISAREGTTPQAPPVEGAANRAPAMTSGLPGDDRQRRNRLKFTFPASARDPVRDPTTVVMVELKIGEVEAAYEAGHGNKQRIAQELAKLSIYKVDGRVVALDDLEAAWPAWSAKVRTLCVLAYDRMHNTSDAEDAAFFASAGADE